MRNSGLSAGDEWDSVPLDGSVTKSRTVTRSLTSGKQIANAPSPGEEALAKNVQDVREGLAQRARSTRFSSHTGSADS